MPACGSEAFAFLTRWIQSTAPKASASAAQRDPCTLRANRRSPRRVAGDCRRHREAAWPRQEDRHPEPAGPGGHGPRRLGVGEDLSLERRRLVGARLRAPPVCSRMCGPSRRTPGGTRAGRMPCAPTVQLNGYAEIDSRPSYHDARDGPARLSRPHEPGRLPGRHRQGRRHRAQGQHLLALLLPRQLDDAVAARGRDPGDEAGRLRAGPDPRLPQPHRRDRRPPRRAREQAGQRRRGARAAQRAPVRGRGVDADPRRGRRPDRRSSSA